MDRQTTKEGQDIYVCFLCGNIEFVEKGVKAPICECEQ